MHKQFQKKPLLRDLLTILLLIVVLVLGFVGGQIYANHRTPKASPLAPTTTHICNCPNMTVGSPPCSC